MSIFVFLLFGLVVGLLARAIMPGNQSMGLLTTILLGIAGSFIGGFVSSLITHHRVTDLHTTGLIGSVVGAFVLLLIMGGLFRGRSVA